MRIGIFCQQQFPTPRMLHGFMAVMNAQLFDDVVDVIFNRVERNSEATSNLLISEVFPCDKFQNLLFA